MKIGKFAKAKQVLLSLLAQPVCVTIIVQFAVNQRPNIFVIFQELNLLASNNSGLRWFDLLPKVYRHILGLGDIQI